MSSLEVRYVVLGAIGTNVYFLVNKETQDLIVVDPADRADFIDKQVKLRGYHPKAILVTHGHFDHISGIPELRKLWPDVPVYAYGEERELMASPWMNRSEAWSDTPCSVAADVWLKDHEKLNLAGFDIEVLHTPGHTSGGCCYYLAEEKTLMAGDTLFLESYGRCDLPTGSQAALFHSIQDVLMQLPDDVDVYPGHNDMTTIGHEREYNPAVF